ncbi:hypothetical protein F5J12DRAFT_815568 [Pisolithus orientalis]|uniref:uncharacterized protein n=1 Tax=Pisolithus orientalis TaxID=936130 RepID=UPI0022246272|nr:uncharacterized protein F5J12DRAFT_815568 [Pisolithus orientalis]KAI6015054.1 hypothetical protein F5J12DRAFT_815568 [Pisolithus orientalis]
MEQAPSFNANPILGPIIIGAVVSGVLYGAATVQAYLYFQRFPRDNWKIKSLVAFEISIQTIHLAFVIAGMWAMVVADYAEPQQLTILPVPTVVTILLCSPIAFAVQAYFVLRVYRLSEQPLLLILGGLLAISKCALHLVFGIAASIVRDAVTLAHNWGWCITGFLVLSIACDTLIAMALSHHLNLRKTGFDRTSRIIDRMIIYTLATGLITSTTELAEAVCFWTMNDNYVWMGLYVIESGLYTNSLLAALNSRALFNRLRNSEVPYELGFSPRGSETAGSSYRDQKAPQPILINVTHETVSSQVDEAPVGSHVREGDNVLTPYGAALTSPK